MTIRYSKRFSQLLVLSLGMSVVTTALARDDEDSKSSSSDDSDDSSSAHRKHKKSSDSDKDADKDSDKDSKSDSEADAEDAKDAKSKSSGKKSKHSAKASAEADTSDSAMAVALLGSFGPSSDSLRGGLGLRAGLHFGEGTSVYFGGIGTYFFGHKQTAAAAGFGPAGSSASRSFMYLGGEAGVDIPVIPSVSMRPYFGLGLGRENAETCGGTNGDCSSNATYALTITPGVAGVYELGSGFFVGADFRFLIAAGASNVSGPVLSATLGIKF